MPSPVCRAVCALALIGSCVQISCHNHQMVGAASKVTSGRVFKVSGTGSIEQQMLFDLQGLSVEPGEFVRNGGFGAPGAMFTVEYVDEESMVRTTTYPFSYVATNVPDMPPPPPAPGAIPPTSGSVKNTGTGKPSSTGDTGANGGSPDPDPLESPSGGGAQADAHAGDDDDGGTDGTGSAATFVAVTGAMLQRADRLAAELGRAELALAQARSAHQSATEKTKSLAETIAGLNLSQGNAELISQLVKELGITDETSPGEKAAEAVAQGNPPDAPPSEKQEEPAATEKGTGGAATSTTGSKDGDSTTTPPMEEQKEKDGKTPPPPAQEPEEVEEEEAGSADSASADPVVAATAAVNAAQAELNRAFDQLDVHLASGRNYMIFRWSDEHQGSAGLSINNNLGMGGAERRTTSGFAIAAGIRRQRLLIGRDLTEQFSRIDPDLDLVGFWEDEFSGTGIITESMQVQTIQYFTRGEFDRFLTLMASASVRELQGALTPEDLLNLKVTLVLTDRKLSSYENRAALYAPEIETCDADLQCLLAGGQPHGCWTTILTVASTFDFLEDVGRLNRRQAAAMARQGTTASSSTTQTASSHAAR